MLSIQALELSAVFRANVGEAEGVLASTEFTFNQLD